MKTITLPRGRLILLFCVVAVLIFVLQVAGAEKPSTKSATWRAATFTGPSFWSTATVLWLADQVKAKSGGRFSIEVYTGGSAGINQPAALSSVRDGMVEMIWCWGPPVASELPAFEVQSLPGLVPGDLRVHRRVAGYVAPETAKLLRKQDVFLYFYCLAEPRQIYSRVPINNLGEMEGKKIRCLGTMESDFTKRLGATPVSVNSADVYTALQQGIIDGAWITDAAALTYKWYEVTSHIIALQDNGSPAGLLIGQDALDRLPSDLKEILLNLQPQFEEKLYENMFTLAEKSRQDLKVKGMKVIEWPEEDMKRKIEIASSIWDGWYRKQNAETKKIFDMTQKSLKEKSPER